MKLKHITVQDVLRFAERHDGEKFFTLATDRSFTLYRKRTGITFDLRPRTGSYFPLNETNLAKYLAIYNRCDPADRHKTSIYDPSWRERSYVPRILAEIQNDELFARRRHDDKEIDEAPSTTRKALYLARIGQGQFRDDLIACQGACFVTGVTDERFLRASHVKPWSKCSDAERLDKHNGLLLSPLYDHLFDRHLISFSDDGVILLSRKIPRRIVEALGIDRAAHGRPFGAKARAYLKHHRAVFQKKDRARNE